MKKLALICFGLLFTTFGFSQDFEITAIGSNYSSTQVENTFNSANLCNLVYKSKSRKITLDDGTKIIFKANNTCGQQDDHVFAIVKWSISGTTLLMGYTHEPNLTKEQKQILKETKQ